MTTRDHSAHQAHRDFLNQYYGISRWFYDITRKYYLFGRDQLLEDLIKEDWTRLIEIGPGTGRNLRYLLKRKKNVVLGGVEASDAMLAYGFRRVGEVRWMQGFAETADYTKLLGERPDRVLFSYCLSMVQEREAALERAQRSVSMGGEVVVVDFGDLSGLPGGVRRALRGWLEAFHVEPLDHAFLSRYTDRVTYGPGRYFVIARLAGISG